MRSNDISQLPVLDNKKKVIGILDEDDILNAVKGSYKNFNHFVYEHMSKNLETIDVKENLNSVLEILNKGKVGIIKDKNIFIGLLTKIDIINHFRKKLLK